jgi:hypothetical protein
MLLFMPETCHLIVGDGSVPPPKWNRSLLNHINEKKREKEGLGPPDYAERDALAKQRGPLRFPNPLKTLRVAAEREGFLVLFYAGIVYSGWYAIMSGMPSQLRDIYGFDDLKVGLMYLPMSGGSILAAFTQGKLVDWSFAYEAKRLSQFPHRESKIAGCNADASSRLCLYHCLWMDSTLPHEYSGAMHYALHSGVLPDFEHAVYFYSDYRYQS